MSTFTPEQRAVIDDRDGELLVAATAGSGKTAVMVERFVEAAVTDGVPVPAMLAISFTEKAAGELRERIRKRLLELGRPELARDAERAYISTIHGLCARILRAHPLDAGVDPRFSVLDEVDAQRMQLRAFDAALASWVAAGGEEAVRLAADFRVEALRVAIIATAELLRSRGERVPALPGAPAGSDPGPLRDALVATARTLEGELSTAKDGTTLKQAMDTLERCLEPQASHPLEELRTLELPAAGRATALQSSGCDAYREALQRYRQAATDAVATPAWELLRGLMSAYAERYAALKQERSALDFADLELEASALLGRSDATRRLWRERFVAVMVDEFQDTNALQLELLDHLAAGRLFAVGDEFQSIYRFRHADVELFGARRSNARASGNERELSTNFRSHPALLAALDGAFGGRTFPAGEFVELRPGRDGDHESEARVELLVTDRAAWSADERPDLGEALPGALAWRLAEARLLAQRIHELIDAGHAPGEIVVLLRAATDMGLYEQALADRGLPTYAIGGRGYFSQRQVADVVAYLQLISNPLDEVALVEVLASPIVGLGAGELVALGNAVRTSKQSLWSVVEGRGPGSEGFAHNGSQPATALMVAAAAGSQGTLFSDAGEQPEEAQSTPLASELRSVLSRFAERLGAHREAAARLALDRLIERVVLDTGYDLASLRMPGGPRRLANVRKLMRLAREHEARDGADLRGFLDRVRALSGEELADREGQAPIEGDQLDAVRLMTIHRAKGLEFDVVCVADLGRRPLIGRDPLRVGGDGRIGLQLPSVDGQRFAAFQYAELAQAEVSAAAAEERRLFYVAMTRARERLILSGAGEPSRWGCEPEPRTEPLWWIARALLDDAGATFDASRPDQTLAAAGDRAALVRCVFSSPETVGDALREDSLAPVARQPAVETPAHPEPAAASATSAAALSEPLPERLSYSALQQYAGCGYRFYLERMLGLVAVDPPVEEAQRPDGADRLSPLERGRLVHELLEIADLGGDAPSAADVRERARGSGVELRADAAAELAALVAGFLAAPLAQRLAGAEDLRREQPFTLALEVEQTGVRLVTGAIDALGGESDGTALVVDYKTDAVSETEDLVVRVERDYAVQRTIYALAVLRSGAPRVEVAHSFLERPLEPASVRFEARDVPELEQVLRARVAPLARGEFGVTPEPHRELCASCPGRAALCSWGPEMTLRERPGG